METTKPWFSKTIVLNSLGLIVQGVALLWPQANLITQFIASHGPELLVGWNVLGILLRLVTKNAISLVD